MYYIVYKTINLVNNKFYIGKHCQTIDPYIFDGYYGSGMQILRTIKKYGKSNFVRETLFVFNNEAECLLKEEELVSQYLGREYCYNMRSGGIGGFEHINKNSEERKRVSALSSKFNKGVCRHIPTQEERLASSERNKKMKESGVGPYSFEAKAKAYKNRDHSKISEKVSGKKNGAYGSKFYRNLYTGEKKRFKLNEQIPEGWVPSLEYTESCKKTHWYNDGIRNYLLDKNNFKIKSLNLKKGRL